MNKVINALKKAYEWLNKEGGLLHLLACYALMLTFAPLGIWWATAITWAVAVGKEIADIARKRNTLLQTINDIIRDAIGWGAGAIVILIQTII